MGEMSSELFTVVFPDGETEYRTSANPPVVGYIFRHRGEDFVVDRIGRDDRGATIVTLRQPEPDSAL